MRLPWRRDDRPFFIPEVVQTSAMDCGPASLKCLLEGFGIRVSYGRLREVCQTDVDGTSISSMASVANDLGLDAQETMLPADHVFLDAARALPAIAVVKLPNGATHFAVLWRRHGRLCQVMDPASGRVWKPIERGERELYSHTTNVSAAAWRDWAADDEFLGALRHRLAALGAKKAGERLIEAALDDEGWASLAALDAAVRFVTTLVREGGARRGARAAALLEQLVTHRELIPAESWIATAVGDGGRDAEELSFRGAVIVRAHGRRDEDDEEAPRELSAQVAATLAEETAPPSLSIAGILRGDGYLNVAILLAIWLAQTAGIVVEALLFRGLFGVSAQVMTRGGRLEVLAGVAGFAALMVLLAVPGSMSALRYGRLIESRLRIALLEKLPKLGDRYFASRITADVADRAHGIGQLRALPQLASSVAGSLFELLLTTAGIVWLDPRAAPLALAGCACAVAIPMLAQPMIAERDLRVRAHVGALARFYLESMVGLAAIRSHSAERAVRREQNERLTEWARASMRLLRASVTVGGLQLVVGTGFAAAILIRHLGGSADAGRSLLLLYWCLTLPAVGSALAAGVRQYPVYRNITLRLFEPLSAPEHETVVAADGDRPAAAAPGVEIRCEDVAVAAAGYTILRDVDLTIAAGEHVAIVGHSGAGKSSLVALLLGWHMPVGGMVRIDGRPLDPQVLGRLRRDTAWVDPTVQIWNRSLLDNLRYGTEDGAAPRVATVVEQADLVGLLEALPDGLQTRLGEGGGLVSGGEGQRVRLARAMCRTDARLVILDEAFRGLDGPRRTKMVGRARSLWGKATLLCITHDVHDTLGFPRVLVVDAGRIVEDGDPQQLAAAGGAYAALLARESQVKSSLLGSSIWRRLQVDDGRLLES